MGLRLLTLAIRTQKPQLSLLPAFAQMFPGTREPSLSLPSAPRFSGWSMMQSSGVSRGWIMALYRLCLGNHPGMGAS